MHCFLSVQVRDKEEDMRQQQMRNIGIMAHVDAGKTTTTERMLFYTGKIHRMGEIDDGATTMDWMVQEQERGITIQSAATTVRWREVDITIIDTPGHVDFTAEVERALRVLDGVVVVLCAVGRVQPQTETVWYQADRYDIPRVCFVNKMDRIGADFFSVLDQVHNKFGIDAVALQIPIGSGTSFEGVIDLITMKEIFWDAASSGEQMEYRPIQSARIAQAREAREKMLDVISIYSDEVTECVLAGEHVPVQLLHAEIRKAVRERRYVPFLCGSSRHNLGVQPLLDAVVEYLPAPQERKAVEGFHVQKKEPVFIAPTAEGPLLALVFKIQYEREAGLLCYVRMYSGKLRTGDSIVNIGKKKRERVYRILRMHSNKSETVECIQAGDIAVIVGLKSAQTGDSVGDGSCPVVLESMHFPEPVISVSLEPMDASSRDKLQETLGILSREDPTFSVREDAETGQLLISGMGELHLDVLTTRMREDFNVQVRVGKPHVTYRESIRKTVERTLRVQRVIGGKEYMAGLTLRVEARKRGAGNEFFCQVKELRGTVCTAHTAPAEIIGAVEHAIRGAWDGGIQSGYPCVDVGVHLLSVEYQELTSSPFIFEAAAVQAFGEACVAAEPYVLEPIMSVELSCAQENVGDVMNVIIQRGGIILGMDSKHGRELVHAQAPMKKMFGFSTDVRSASRGGASFTMRFSHFESCA
ncbi:translation elongation factor G [Treponema pallidum subsp. pallidum str. Sea 81-4]|nr:translation elongation factor G [Treponema pallidum subsp. pallidum str. Chicago]AHN67131.1 translation elongation factor G [Treponema pallidum subsp. pallidum str. Sea 81-4]ANA42153.1 elongation factor EF2 [Treponema pallidum subsp. pallidum]